MTRPLRIQYPGAWYHVMNRGRRREKIFLSPADYSMFLSTLQEAAEEWRLQVAAYCLLPNHYHLLIRTPDGNLSRCMRHVNGVYTQRFNRRNHLDGQLFRGRYKAILVDADNYLLEVLRYIHRNPVRAGMEKTVDAYKWSSHKGYCSAAAKWSWLYKSELLGMFSDKPRKAVMAYNEFVSFEESKSILDFFSLKNTPSILGDQSFKDWVKEQFMHLRARPEIPESHQLSFSPELVIKVVCRFYHLTEESFLVSKRGQTNIPRDVAIYLIRRHSNKTLAEIGTLFGIGNYSTVSTVVSTMKSRIDSEPQLAKDVASIEKQLAKSQQ